MKVVVAPSEQGLPDDVLKLKRNLFPYPLNESEAAVARSLTRSATQASEDAEQPRRESRRLPGELLEYWDVQIHTYTRDHAGHVGLLAGLFGGNSKKVEAGVVHDAKRYTVISTEEGRNVEVGVSVRMAVATNSFDHDMNLTLPNLAASAQLKQTDTRVGISVMGFTGALGDLLPSPSKFDVETCVEYLNSFKAIQKHVFSTSNERFIVPTILLYDNDEWDEVFDETHAADNSTNDIAENGDDFLCSYIYIVVQTIQLNTN